MHHVLIVPELPKQQPVIVEPEVARLDKLRMYHRHFNVFIRYKLTFKQFVKKVDSGTWEAYLAN